MPTTAHRAREPSPHQRRILEFVSTGNGHAVVQATAGSGKTTTLVAVAHRLPASRRACFLAFNRATAAELKARLPPHVEATTIHALGRRLLLERFPRLRTARPDANKYRALAYEALTLAKVNPTIHREAAIYLSRLLGFMRLELTPANDDDAVTAVERRYGIEDPLPGSLGGELRTLLPGLLENGRAVAALGHLDLTDLVYLPVTLSLRSSYYFVCVDEAQDLSRLTLAFVQQLVEAGARALFVGDPHQAIYGFAGADERSLARIVRRTGAVTLPLSVSYRCPARHVLLARRFSAEMAAAPGAPPGRVKIISERHLARHASPGDLVMSRVNAPLVALSLRLVEAGIPARVLGQEMSSELLLLARRLFPGRLPLSAPEITLRHGRENAARIEQRLLSSLTLARALSDDADRHHALAILLRHLRAGAGPFEHDHLAELAHLLLNSPSSSTDTKHGPPGVVLSTIHKAKGREAQRTFLLYPEELAPVRSARADKAADGMTVNAGANSQVDTQMETAAEANVLFVALTRSKRELVLVERRRGAIAARIRQQRRGATHPSTTGDDLAARWTQVLSLARTMARAPPA